MSRKTVDLASLISRVNGMNAAPSPTADARMALNGLLEQILMDADQYKGFQYVFPGGERVPSDEVREGNYDNSRRRYYVSLDLRGE